MSSSSNLFEVTQIVVRVVAMALTAVAFAVMLTSDEPIILLETRLGTAHYAYSSAFRFIAIVDMIVCVGSAISLIILFALLRNGKPYSKGFLAYAFLYDQTLASLMLAACSAATAVGLIGRNGLPQNFWLPVCGQVPKFCNKVTVSLALSYMASSCYGILAFMVVNKIKEGDKGVHHGQGSS